MPIPLVIDALRRLAFVSGAGEAKLIAAADYLQSVQDNRCPEPQMPSEWLLPPPVPQR